MILALTMLKWRILHAIGTGTSPVALVLITLEWVFFMCHWLESESGSTGTDHYDDNNNIKTITALQPTLEQYFHFEKYKEFLYL